MRGKSSSSFDPDGTLTLAEAITIAVRLHDPFTEDRTDPASSDPWYASYVEYARERVYARCRELIRDFLHTSGDARVL